MGLFLRLRVRGSQKQIKKKKTRKNSFLWMNFMYNCTVFNYKNKYTLIREFSVLKRQFGARIESSFCYFLTFFLIIFFVFLGSFDML